MSNPVAGQDYTVSMATTESLVDATVTIEYRKPDLSLVVDVEPTNVDTDNNVITYKMPNTLTTHGTWRIGAKIVFANDDIGYVNPAVVVYFENKLT
jgi:hypothetical protein